MTDLTPEVLDTIEARANAATQGPWKEGRTWDDKPDGLTVSHGWGGSIALVHNPQVSPATPEGSPAEKAANIDFIAHAREDIPALVAELRRLRTENEEQGRLIRGQDGLTVAEKDAWTELLTEKRALQAKIDAALGIYEPAQSIVGYYGDVVADQMRTALTGEAKE